MEYLSTRQDTLARNIANADTPGYRPSDVNDIDFGSVLEHVSNRGKANVRLDTTNPMHMPAPGQLPNAESREAKITYEVAPAENAVILEEQMVKANQNMIDFRLTTNIMRKNIGMVRTALGRT